jgi:hypothetical protein
MKVRGPIATVTRFLRLRRLRRPSRPERVAALTIEHDEALHRRRCARAERQARARKGADTKFNQRMEGLKRWQRER